MRDVFIVKCIEQNMHANDLLHLFFASFGTKCVEQLETGFEVNSITNNNARTTFEKLQLLNLISMMKKKEIKTSMPLMKVNIERCH